MASVPFWKVESIGNDFVLVHLDDVERLRDEMAVDDFLRRLAIAASERRFGIGSDGLLAVGMEGDVLVDRMFNPDGTEDFCGNGLRCVALHAQNQGWVGERFVIHHLDRNVPTRIENGVISTEIGSASYDPGDIPAQFEERPKETFDRFPIWGDLRGSVLTTGSTHTVIFGPLPSDELFERVSPQIENDPQFPERTSVIWAEVVSPMKLRIRIWERGAGETLGCGTGSSAAAVDYLRRNSLGGEVEVINQGGTIIVSAESWNAPITIRGDAKEIYSGEFPLSFAK